MGEWWAYWWPVAIPALFFLIGAGFAFWYLEPPEDEEDDW